MPKGLGAQDWSRIRAAWVAGMDPVAQLARRFSVSPSTIRRRADRDGWPGRPASRTHPQQAARLLYAELTEALRDGLVRLRNADPDDPEPVADARERAQTIRAHRRALLALIEADRALGNPGDAVKRTKTGATDRDGASATPVLDLASAREEVLARLDRLVASVDGPDGTPGRTPAPRPSHDHQDSS